MSGTVIKFNENIIEVQIDHDEHLQHAMRGQKFQIEKYKFLIRDEHNNIAAVRDQFPLKLGYSVTVDKAHGRTLDAVVVDAYNFWRCGQLGVAVG